MISGTHNRCSPRMACRRSDGRNHTCETAWTRSYGCCTRSKVARWEGTLDPVPLTKDEGEVLLTEHTDALFGPPPAGRSVRVMVTMPGEAAADYIIIRDLVAAGMDCMRINCAHDDATAWAQMIEHLRRANGELRRRCRVSMDIGGPKLRTGSVTPGPAIIKI